MCWGGPYEWESFMVLIFMCTDEYGESIKVLCIAMHAHGRALTMVWEFGGWVGLFCVHCMDYTLPCDVKIVPYGLGVVGL